MKVHIVAVGKLKNGYVAEGVKDYYERIKHYIPITMVETNKKTRST